jgi:hypothetical protein
MRIPKFSSPDKNIFFIAYKLLHDALFLLLISFIVMLIAEGALPGVVSSHISFTRIIIAILLILMFIILIGKKFQLTYLTPSIKKNRLLPVLVLLSFLLLGNSLLKFALWENIVITLSTLFLFFLFYQIIFNPKN